MIEPYGSIIKSMLHDFQSLNLVIVTDDDYKITLSNAKYSLIIATERHYQPSVTSSLLCETGQKFAIGLSKRILAPTKFESNGLELKKIKIQYQLDDSECDKNKRAAGIYIYVKVAIKQTFEFVSENSELITDSNRKFLAAYLAMEKNILTEFGI